MKLLFDENLSPVLPAALADCYGESHHVRDVDLKASSDADVWLYAVRNDLVIVTKDSDFRDLSILRGFPPLVVWLRIGNCSTREIEHLLRRSHATIVAFAAESTTGLLTLIGR